MRINDKMFLFYIFTFYLLFPEWQLEKSFTLPYSQLAEPRVSKKVLSIFWTQKRGIIVCQVNAALLMGHVNLQISYHYVNSADIMSGFRKTCKRNVLDLFYFESSHCCFTTFLSKSSFHLLSCQNSYETTEIIL